MEIRFADHSRFHRAAAGMVGSSAIIGLALHPFTPVAPLVGGLAGIAIGTTLAHGKPAWRLIPAGIGIGSLLVVAGTSHGLTTASPDSLAYLSGWLMAMVGIPLALGLRGRRALIASALGLAVTLLGLWTATRFSHAQQTQSWPAWLTAMTAATSMGLVGVFSLIPRHLFVSSDPVTAAVRRLPVKLDGEVSDLCRRSVAIWTTTKDKLDATDPSRELVRDGVLTTLEVAMKSTQVAMPGTPSTEGELATRAADLDARIAAATDPETRTQYESARAAIGDQQRYRDQIRQNRERLVARMHNHVAALEKFQLAASGLESSRAARDVAASAEALTET